MRSRLASYIGILVIVALGAGGYYYFLNPVPCAKPISYRIGTLDEKFGLNRTQFLSTIEEGSFIWERAINKDLFVHDEKGKLVINLIYDERQRETLEQQRVEQQIAATELFYTQKRNELEVLQERYNIAESAFSDLLEAFKAASAEYQSEVAMWNSRGGAPKSEYSRLVAQQQALLTQQADLEAKRIEVNALADSVNALVVEVNQLAQETNTKVKEYNSGDLVGTIFDQGLYVRDAHGTAINIYQFSDRPKLVRVLAHELGHALGLEHNQNPDSIMYELNQGDKEKLSKDDLTELKALCGLSS